MSQIGCFIGSPIGATRVADPRWIWQQPDWPHFHWQAETLAPLLRACQQAQGRLLGMAGAIAGDAQAEGELDTLLQNIITSSAIEGERLNVASVRSSLARRLGVAGEEGAPATPRSEGLAELMLDATQHHDAPLDTARLFHWHAWLFPQPESLLAHPIRVGSLRGDEPMQVVSGRIDRPTVHFEAPPRAGAGSAARCLPRLVQPQSRRCRARSAAARRHGAFLVCHPAPVRRRQRSPHPRHHRPGAGPGRASGHPLSCDVGQHPGRSRRLLPRAGIQPEGRRWISPPG